MKYQLGIDGKVVGTYSLKELRERVTAGELSGTEYVLGEGWTEWRPLDLVLLENEGPAPAAKRGLNQGQRILLWILIPAGLMVVIIAAVVVTYIVGRKWEHDKLLARAQQLRAQQIQQLQERRQKITGQTPDEQAQSDADDSAEAAESLAAASKPIVTGTNFMTSAVARRREADFFRRQWVDGFKERGVRNPNTDAKAQQFLNAWVGEFYGAVRDTNGPPTQQLATEFAKESAPVDPIVLMAAAIDCPESFEAQRRLQRALTGFENSKHRAFPRFYANVLLASIGGQDAGEIHIADEAALKFLRQSFTDGSISPEDQNEIAELFLHRLGEKFFERNEPAAIETVGSGPDYRWLRSVLQGRLLTDSAWAARGGGYADTVSEQGWATFFQDMAGARMAYSNAWTLRPDLPAAPSAMIAVANATSNITETRWWFDKATEAQVDYAPAWEVMRFALRPRWHGTEKSMLAFGTAALNTRRFDTDVPAMFIETLRDLRSENSTVNYYGRRDIWLQLRQMFDGYIAASSSDRQKQWRGLYAAMASELADYPDARKQLEAVNWEPPSRFEMNWNIDLALVPAKVAAYTSPDSHKISAADVSRLQGAAAQSLMMFTTLSKSAGMDERARQYIQTRMAALEIEERLGTGEWVDFLPQSDSDPNWVVQAGKTHVTKDGALEVESGAHGHYLWARSRVGAAFEIRGEFDVVSTSSRSFQAGIVMGWPDLHSDNWNAFRIKRNADEGDVASYSNLWSRRQGVKPMALHDTHNSFDFKFQYGRATATVNGVTAFNNVSPPTDVARLSMDYRLGIGAFNDMNDTVIRYSKVQVRKLSNSTPSAR